MSTAALTKPKPVPAIVARLRSEDFVKELQQTIPATLRKVVSPEELTSVVINQFRKNPKLMACSPTSIIDCLFRAARMGLPLDGEKAHLIPYGKEATLIVDWKGYVHAALVAGYKNVKPVLVKKLDSFVYQEDDGTGRTFVKHDYNPMEERGDVIGAYSRSVSGDGYVDYEFMSIKQLEDIRIRSKANTGPWKTDTEEMQRKTVIRRHRKRWNLAPEVSKAFAEYEREEFQKHRPTITVHPAVPDLLSAPEQPAAEEPTNEVEFIEELEAWAEGQGIPLGMMSEILVGANMIPSPIDDWHKIPVAVAEEIMSDKTMLKAIAKNAKKMMEAK